jgi:MFS transporter, ACS family, tartrate transporter
MSPSPDTQALERRTIAKVSWRLLPLVALGYCIAYISARGSGSRAS